MAIVRVAVIVNMSKSDLGEKKNTWVALTGLGHILLLRPRPQCAEGILKRRFHSENATNIFRLHYVRGICKRNINRSFGICVWGKLGQWNRMIIVPTSFLRCFRPCTCTGKQSLRFEKRFRKAPFSWRRISADGRPNRRKKGTFPNSSVAGWRGPQLHESYFQKLI